MMGGSGKEKSLQQLGGSESLTALELHELSNLIDGFDDLEAIWELRSRLMVMAKDHGLSDDHFACFGLRLFSD